MKTSKTIAILLVFALSINSCGQEKEAHDLEVSMMEIPEEVGESVNMEMAEYKQHQQPSAEYDMDFSNNSKIRSISAKKNQIDFATSKAASAENDGDKKFIRQAQLNIKAKDIVSATHAIEDIIIAKKGFIIKSYLSSDDRNYTETRVTKDSILVSNEVYLGGTLVLRVHYSLLDQALREIALLTEQVTLRNVTAQDVTFDMIANRLEQKRENDKAARMKNIAGPNKGHKLEDLIAAEDAISYARVLADNAVVEEMKRDDHILYSTITIQLEQAAPIVIQTMKAREADVEEYSPPFFRNLGYAIKDGWNGLLELVVGLFTVWPLVLFTGAIIYAIIYFRRKKRGQRMGE